MPAIQLKRLHKQTDELAQLFNDPPRFVKQLHELLGFYADRTRRAGLEQATAPLTHTYNPPAPVLQRVLFVITPLAKNDIVRALLLADICWQEETFEFRQLAANILSILPSEATASILERLPTWVFENKEPKITQILANKSLALIYHEHPAYLIPYIEEWLAADKPRQQIFGLLALSGLLQNPKYDNLPVVFRILKPRMLNSVSSVRSYLLDVIEKLIQKSTAETSFYLNNLLKTESEDRTIRWIVRHSLEHFPNEYQEKLRSAMRK